MLIFAVSVYCLESDLPAIPDSTASPALGAVDRHIEGDSIRLLVYN